MVEEVHIPILFAHPVVEECSDRVAYVGVTIPRDVPTSKMYSTYSVVA
jgi:hypothetical protein